MAYVWEREDWPNFTYLTDGSQDLLYRYAMEATSLVGAVSHLRDDEKRDAVTDLMVSEAVKTSQIEGENFDRQDVRSSIRNQLGLNTRPEPVRNQQANGIAELMISARQTFSNPLTKEQLFAWHEMVITDPYQRRHIDVGAWRTEPVQIVSGPVGSEKVHYEAPPADRLELEMESFLKWFNNTAPCRDNPGIPGPIRAAVAHLYFECIHPFTDGNGRIGRAISEKALSQELRCPVFMSLSTAIEAERTAYYDELNVASKGDMEISRWVNYFVSVTLKAQLQAKQMIDFVLEKARFWDKYYKQLNERQTKTIKRLFMAGTEGFEGGMSAKKYASLTGCSKATATRDLTDLMDKGCLRKLASGGRSTRYELVIDTTAKLDTLRNEITQGLNALDRGEGKSLDIEDIKRKGREKLNNT